LGCEGVGIFGGADGGVGGLEVAEWWGVWFWECGEAEVAGWLTDGLVLWEMSVGGVIGFPFESLPDPADC